jgi:hypothetical protein
MKLKPLITLIAVGLACSSESPRVASSDTANGDTTRVTSDPAVQIEPRCVRSIDNVCVARVSYREPPVPAAFQADGKYLGEVRFPLGASHIRMSGQFAWAMIHHDDGVPVLAKYRLY